VSLRALDPETAEAIDELNKVVFPKFGDIYTFWTELLDPGGTGAVSQTEFVADVGREFDIAANTLARIFSCLDTANTGWVAVTEVGFLEAFEGSQSALHASQTLQPQPGLRLPQLHSSAVVPAADGLAASSRVRSPATPTFACSNAGLGRSASWSDGGASRMSSSNGGLATSASELRRSVGDVTTRSSQRTAYAQSYMLKHRWLRSSAMERIAHRAKGAGKTRLPKKTGQGDIFRSTNEFYREGVQMLQEHFRNASASGNDSDD